jgi:hypothetical protein
MAVTAFQEAGASGNTISNKHGFPSSALNAAVSEPMIRPSGAVSQRAFK